MLFQRLNNRKGFTLIEVMVAISIIAIMAAFITPKACSVSIKSNDKVIIQQDEKVVDKKTKPVLEQKQVNKQSKNMKKL